MSVIHIPPRPQLDTRLLLFPAVCFLGLSVLFLRLWYVQVVKAPELAERAFAAREIEVSKLAPRGLIYDRQGRLLAGVRSEIVVTGKPALLGKNPQALRKLAQILEESPEKLKAKLQEGFWRPHMPTPLFVGASVRQAARIGESAEELPGVGVESQPMRYYQDTVSFTHVLGYLGVPSVQDVERMAKEGEEPAAYVGRRGVERAFERALMGTPGTERLQVDVKRRPRRVVGRDGAEPGQALVLSLDAKLQKHATALLQGKGFKGGVAALDPKTGEVLCLVSSPTYDQNIFRNGLSQAEFDRLNHHPGKPLLNRATHSAYAPGSTFKIVTTIAALQSGVFDPNWTVVCTGRYREGVKRGPRCMGTHGAITFQRAMQQSCNTYFITLGRRAGPDALRKACQRVGLGEAPDLEIGSAPGIVPTMDYIRRWRKPPVWQLGDTLNFAIGQGEMSATPLQMAGVAALVANNGVGFAPHLVREVRSGPNAERARPRVVHQVRASATFWKGLKNALVSVIESGTARVAQIEGVRWGGKTGSAEHRKGAQTHSWFVGFAPADNPKIAICVFVEAAGHGGSIAAPIARDLVKGYLADKSAKTDAKSVTAASASKARRSSPKVR